MNRSSLCRQVFMVSLWLVPTAVAVTPEFVKNFEGDEAVSDLLGWSLEIDGDTMIAGAPGNIVEDPGAVYVLVKSAGWWRQQAKLVADDAMAGDGFGGAGDVDGDTVVIGAPGYIHPEPRGSAYVFQRSGSSWQQVAKLTPQPQADHFGRAVEVDDETIAVGAVGSVYLYARLGSGWQLQTVLVPDGDTITRGDSFGNSLALDGGTLVVGAGSEQHPEPDASGAAYVFVRQGAEWRLQQKLYNPESLHHFGGTIDLAEDTLVIAAHSQVMGLRPPASVLVYTRSGGTWSRVARLVAYQSNGRPHEFIAGDLATTGDRVVAHAQTGEFGFASGSAILFRRLGETWESWEQEARLLPNPGHEYEEFGAPIAMDGSTIAIAAPHGFGRVEIFSLDRARPHLVCPGDIDGDGTHELALVSSSGVTVKSLAGDLFHHSAPISVDPVDVEPLSDVNGNGAPELAMVNTVGDSMEATVVDSLTGAILTTVSFNAPREPLDLEPLGDQTGNGAPELAVLDGETVSVLIADAASAQHLRTLHFDSYVYPQDLEAFPDLGGNGLPELSVLGDHQLRHYSSLRPSGRDKLEMRDPASGEKTGEIWVDRNWRVRSQALLTDQDGNGSTEVAVLRTKYDGAVNVMVRDTLTGRRLGYLGFERKYPPMKMLTIADQNSNGADEVVVFGVRADGTDNKAQISDARTGSRLATLRFGANLVARDITSCGDLNGNGAEELAFLGQPTDESEFVAIVKDARTGQQLAYVRF